LDYSENHDDHSRKLSDKPPKHIAQIESIVLHMQRNGLLPPPITPLHSFNCDSAFQLSDDLEAMDEYYYFVEFGCGTAKLSDHVSTTVMQQQQRQEQVSPIVPSNQHIRYVLIDQQPMKAVERYCDGRIRARHHQMYGKTDDTIATEVVQRLTCPISQIPLYDTIHPTTTDISLSAPQHRICAATVAMAKHLCGSATDDAIRCTQKYCVDEIHRRGGTDTRKTTSKSDHHHKSNENMSSRSKIASIPLIIATCCHYACDAKTLLAYKFTLPTIVDNTGYTDNHHHDQLSYLQYIGFDERDIEVLIIVSQWASIKLNVTTVDVPLEDGECVVQAPATEQHPSTSLMTGTNAESSLFDSQLADNGRDVIIPDVDRDKMVFPPPLPPQPIPTTIPADVETNMRLSSNLFEEQFSRQGKHELGQYSKLLIDMTRVYYLRYNNVAPYNKVQLLYYTKLSVERHLLIAT
jgi:hypothetical protein